MMTATWKTMARLGFSAYEGCTDGSIRSVDRQIGNRTVKGAVFVQPGHPDDAVTLHLGYGRRRGGVRRRSVVPCQRECRLGACPTR